MYRYDDQVREVEAGAAAGEELAALVEEVRRLRRAVRRQEHAQELFQGRVEEALSGLSRAGDGPHPTPRAGEPPAPGSAQLRALLELDQALLHLLSLTREQPGMAAPELPAEAPRSVREGLGLLQVRVRNLQHSFGLEPIPAVGRPFDDRWHRAQAVVRRPELPDRQVVEEVLPGYRLGERLLRPALVVVNRLDPPPGGDGAETRFEPDSNPT